MVAVERELEETVCLLLLLNFVSMYVQEEVGHGAYFAFGWQSHVEGIVVKNVVDGIDVDDRLRRILDEDVVLLRLGESNRKGGLIGFLIGPGLFDIRGLFSSIAPVVLIVGLG
jgi:hypothetical protein